MPPAVSFASWAFLPVPWGSAGSAVIEGPSFRPSVLRAVPAFAESTLPQLLWGTSATPLPCPPPSASAPQEPAKLLLVSLLAVGSGP